jgi:hypothetical protein
MFIKKVFRFFEPFLRVWHHSLKKVLFSNFEAKRAKSSAKNKKMF